jgi:hypothetical protein
MMDWIRRNLLTVGLSLGFWRTPASAGILKDVSEASENGAKALNALGYKADFTFESIRELERFMKDNVEPEGGAKAGGQLTASMGSKLFLLGAYLGETIRRKVGGVWHGDDSDPEATTNVEVVGPNESVIWPIQRIMKRFQNGDEDDLWAYALAAAEE